MLRFTKVIQCLLILSICFSPGVSFALCPDLEKGEVAMDCPWAEVGRVLQTVKASSEALERTLNERVPGLVSQLNRDQSLPAIKTLWGRSVNFDEGAKAQILEPEIVEALAVHFKSPVSARYFQDREVVHAGMEHTYGYLFSLLRTPYGYKRARWVGGEIEDGMGLPKGMFSPTPAQGTLFLNVSYFIGRIAFRNDSHPLNILKAEKSVPESLSEFPYAKLAVIRLQEEFRIPTSGENRVVTIRTDFVPFKEATGGSNTHLLIYSLIECESAEPKLITAFPVNSSTVNQSTAPNSLGEGRPIQLRYNAYSEGLYGVKFTGKRWVE